MIDFQNASFVKLRETNPADYDNVVRPLLITGRKCGNGVSRHARRRCVYQ